MFIVAHIPMLLYDTYDVFVEILNKDDLVTSSYFLDVHFKMAYIVEEFTKVHLIVRYSFMGLSLIICLWYLCVICRIPRNVPITFDQKSLQWITISLVWFNDPLMALTINFPNYGLSILSSLWTAIFFSLLL
jgi:hypothetical protein